MPIEPLPERDAIAVEDGEQLMLSPPFKGFFKSIFIALFGWKRTYTKLATIDFGNIAAQGQLTSDVAVPGARQGDAVQVTPKTQVAGLDVYGVVTANDVVRVVRVNYSAGAIDPVPDDFRIVVFQQ